MFATLKSLAWPGDGVAPDETEHLWRGFLSEDIQARVPMVALHTQLTSEEELRDLKEEIRKFLEPLAYATQSMLSTRFFSLFSSRKHRVLTSESDVYRHI